MTAAAGYTLPRHMTLYHVTTHIADPSATTVAAAAVANNLVKDAIPGVNIEQTGNTIEFSVMGSATRKQLSDAATIPPFAFSIATDLTDTKHAALIGASPGDTAAMILQVKTGDSAVSWFYMQGTLGTVSPLVSTEGTQTLSSFTLNQDQAPLVFHKA